MSYERSQLMQSRLEQNKEAILTAAKVLIGEGGFKKAQIGAIATMAGVSNGLVYRYFDNKSQVMIEVLNQVSDIEINILNAIADSDLSASDKLHKAVRVFVKRALNDPHMAYSLMLEPTDDESFEKARFLVKKNITKAIERILSEGKSAGVFLVDGINICALCIVGAMTYSVIEPLNANQNSPFYHIGGIKMTDEYRAYFSNEVADFCLSSAQVLVKP